MLNCVFAEMMADRVVVLATIVGDSSYALQYGPEDGYRTHVRLKFLILRLCYAIVVV